jgi:nuclease-like protein
MRLVRVGGRYLEGREQRLWMALAGLLALASAGIIVAVEIPGGRPLYLAAGCVAVLTALRLGGPVARRLRNVRKGRLGERLVVDLLRGLPDDYWLVNDITLGLAHGNIDHVLIGPCGVVVIETKRLAGNIRCWGDDWSIDGYVRKSVSRQVNSGACAVRYFLSERHPDLAASALRWVESIIVFTHPLCRMEVNRARTTIVRYSQLFQVVLELGKKHRMAPATAAQLAQTLANAQARRAAEAGRGTLTVAP